jgi:hypothetical protein
MEKVNVDRLMKEKEAYSSAHLAHNGDTPFQLLVTECSRAAEYIARLEAIDQSRLVELLEEYIKLLGDELSDAMPFLHVHGWQSKRVEAGQIMRDKIQAEKDRLSKIS